MGDTDGDTERSIGEFQRDIQKESDETEPTRWVKRQQFYYDYILFGITKIYVFQAKQNIVALDYSMNGQAEPD